MQPEASPALAMNVIVGRAVAHADAGIRRRDDAPDLPALTERAAPRSWQNEVLPAIERDPGYPARHDMEMVPGADGGAAQCQRPGAKNLLRSGEIHLLNDADVYLHRHAGARAVRAQPARLQPRLRAGVADPLALALWLLKDQPA